MQFLIPQISPLFPFSHFNFSYLFTISYLLDPFSLHLLYFYILLFSYFKISVQHTIFCFLLLHIFNFLFSILLFFFQSFILKTSYIFAISYSQISSLSTLHSFLSLRFLPSSPFLIFKVDSHFLINFFTISHFQHFFSHHKF